VPLPDTLAGREVAAASKRAARDAAWRDADGARATCVAEQAEWRRSAAERREAAAPRPMCTVGGRTDITSGSSHGDAQEAESAGGRWGRIGRPGCEVGVSSGGGGGGVGCGGGCSSGGGGLDWSPRRFLPSRVFVARGHGGRRQSEAPLPLHAFYL